MNILFAVEFYEPHKGGAEEVVRQLAERLAARGHKVAVATTRLPARSFKELNGVSIEDFAISGNSVRGIIGEDAETKRYQDYVTSGFDAVIINAAQVWTADLAFPVLEKIQGKKIFIPCGYSGLRNLAFKGYFAKLPEYLRKFDKLVYMSAHYQDKAFGDEHGVGDRAVLIPNGASEEEFLRLGKLDVKKQLGITTKYLAITVANHYRDKGHGFVIDAFLKMGRTDTTLLVIGENPGVTVVHKIKQFIRGCYKTCMLNSMLHNNIKLVRGSNRELVLNAYRQADLFLFGSKVECAPLVLYESFASKTVFISTPVGNVPDYADYVRLVTTPEDMATAANFLLDHPDKKHELAEKCFELWKEKYTWDKIAEEYEKLLTAS